VVLLFLGLSILLWKFLRLPRNVNLVLPFPTHENGDFPILSRDVSFILSNTVNTAQNPTFHIVCLQDICSPTKSFAEFHMVCYSILSLTTMYIVASSQSWLETKEYNGEEENSNTDSKPSYTAFNFS
jgi:hypothetical protein